ncbi:DNA double-strand break repair nuclease NurA [Haloquadratum walsbyi]|nr:DNA double-strand break repair nuclease NurA [Haloquadratum walsbyi]
MSRLLAASRHHEVPVIGFTSGSKGRDLAVMLEHLNEVDAPQKVRDFRVLLQELGNWGDRSVLFRTQRGSTMNRLSTSYHGGEYDFSDRLLFTYLNTGSGQSLDRVGIPKWVHEEGMVDEVLSTVRAQAAVGRGFPEILSAADADAVISNTDRDRFLEIMQTFSEANDIDIRWVDKALNKRRRRR